MNTETYQMIEQRIDELTREQIEELSGANDPAFQKLLQEIEDSNISPPH